MTIKKLLLITFLPILFFSCEPSGDVEPNNLLVGKWKLMSFEVMVKNVGEDLQTEKGEINGVETTIEFNADGTFSGGSTGIEVIDDEFLPTGLGNYKIIDGNILELSSSSPEAPEIIAYIRYNMTLEADDLSLTIDKERYEEILKQQYELNKEQWVMFGISYEEYLELAFEDTEIFDFKIKLKKI